VTSCRLHSLHLTFYGQGSYQDDGGYFVASPKLPSETTQAKQITVSRISTNQG
jgi:hypothetical protein